MHSLEVPFLVPEPIGNDPDVLEPDRSIQAQCPRIARDHRIELKTGESKGSSFYQRVLYEKTTDTLTAPRRRYGIACVRDMGQAADAVGVQDIEAAHLVPAHRYGGERLPCEELLGLLIGQWLFLRKGNASFHYLIPKRDHGCDVILSVGADHDRPLFHGLFALSFMLHRRSFR